MMARLVGEVPGVWNRAVYVFRVRCASARSSVVRKRRHVAAKGPRYGARGGKARMVGFCGRGVCPNGPCDGGRCLAEACLRGWCSGNVLCVPLGPCAQLVWVWGDDGVVGVGALLISGRCQESVDGGRVRVDVGHGAEFACFS